MIRWNTTESRLVAEARAFAMMQHLHQTYPPAKVPANAEFPGVTVPMAFHMHLGNVVGVLHRFNITDPAIHAAAWLHDVLEDTDATVDAMREALLWPPSHDPRDEDRRRLMLDVVEIVQAVTDEPGANRKERKAKTYPKIVGAGERAGVVKYADRIANVEAARLGGAGHDFLSIYTREHGEFTHWLGGLMLNNRAMRDYLDKLITGAP